MEESVYDDGDYIVQMGEAADALFLIQVRKGT